MTVKIATPLETAKLQLKNENIPFIEIGNYGFVALRGIYGSDDLIAQTARVTTSSDKKDARGLIRNLMRNYHTSPFENSHIDLDVALPIFVERQWARHRTAGWNEISARYAELPAEQYEIESHRYQKEPELGQNRQGSGQEFDDDNKSYFKEKIKTCLQYCVDTYKSIRYDKFTPELSRTVLPLNTYTRKRWWIDLHNLLHFLNLRLKSDAQYEIREFANAIYTLVQPHFPITFEAFIDFRLEAVQFSKIEKRALAELINDQKLFKNKIDSLFSSKTELKEFNEKINKIMKDK